MAKKETGPLPQHKRLAMGQDVLKQGAGGKGTKSSDKKSTKK